MKKSQRHLLVLAKKFEKYANRNAEDYRSEIESDIWTNLRNAAGQRQYGIIPFPQMATTDGINLSFDVTNNDRTITVSNLNIAPAEKNNLLPKYQPLTTQIKAFLEKYWEIYPTKRNGEELDYSNFTVHLSYPNEPQVAQK
jgi:hypothetical protein